MKFINYIPKSINKSERKAIKNAIVACLIYLGLASLDIVNPIYGFVFLYVVFPYLVLILLGYVFYLAKEKQLKKGKSIFRKLFVLLIILMIVFTISIFSGEFKGGPLALGHLGLPHRFDSSIAENVA